MGGTRLLRLTLLGGLDRCRGNGVTTVLAPELRRRIGNRHFGIVATLQCLGKEKADIATALGDHLDVMPGP